MKSMTAAFAAGMLAFGASPAAAGGFAPHEQSAYFMGTAFAGSAAGGVLSSMFWNPAALGQFSGIQSDSNYSLILPESSMTATSGSLFSNSANSRSGDIGDTAILPASYMSYQYNDKIVLGLGINAPFGLTTDPSNRIWDGAPLARESKIETYNFTPTIAYRLSPGIIVGAGLQIEYFKTRLARAAGPVAANSDNLVVKLDDVALGFTAGVLLTPAQGTSIGIGFRSSIDHDLEGDVFGVPAFTGLPPSASDGTASLETPEILTVSLRQSITPDWTLLGSVEWTNWSRVGAVTVTAFNGLLQDSIVINYEDGWLFSAGLEHNYNDRLSLRGGVAYEISPARDPESRIVQVPDADRFWLTAGASYVMNENTTIDLSYAHVFVEDARFSTGGSFGTLAGDVESSVNIVSVGVRSKLDWLLSGGH